MREYQIYKLVEGAHVADPPQVFTRDSDGDAIEHAKQLVDGHDIELWQDGCFIIALRSRDKK